MRVIEKCRVRQVHTRLFGCSFTSPLFLFKSDHHSMSSRSSSQDGSERGASSEVMATPAPASKSQMLVPDAPTHKATSIDLPTSTPASSSTPTVRADVSEFDPFATPAPAPAAGPSIAQSHVESRSGSTPGRPTPSRSRVEETPRRGDEREDPPEPPFNFPGFLKDLRLKSAEPVARYLKRCASRLWGGGVGWGASLLALTLSFLNNFAKKQFSVNEQIKLIHDFLEVRWSHARLGAAQHPSTPSLTYTSSSMARCDFVSRGNRSPRQNLTMPWKRWKSWS